MYAEDEKEFLLFCPKPGLSSSPTLALFDILQLSFLSSCPKGPFLTAQLSGTHSAQQGPFIWVSCHPWSSMALGSPLPLGGASMQGKLNTGAGERFQCCHGPGL